MEFTHVSRIVPMRDNVFNLEKAVQEILDGGLMANAKDITIFVNFDGFEIFPITRTSRTWVKIGGENYSLVIEEADLMHHSGDVRLKYNTRE